MRHAGTVLRAARPGGTARDEARSIREAAGVSAPFPGPIS